VKQKPIRQRFDNPGDGRQRFNERVQEIGTRLAQEAPPEDDVPFIVAHDLSPERRLRV
jgi:hypothetical protein